MPERYINPSERGSYWKSASHREKYDSPEDAYFAYRVEGAGKGSHDLSIAHSESFIRTVIPGLISKFKGEKIKILESGGGACFHADQIRTIFPDAVEVFTTGLKKKWALEIRKNPSAYGVPEDVINVIKNFPKKLHKNDLKWRSILELTPGPEFHLIIENYGEYFYSKNNEYLTAALDKLVSGGELSIYPVYSDDQRKPEEYLKLNSGHGFKVSFTEPSYKIGKGYKCLKIFKE